MVIPCTINKIGLGNPFLLLQITPKSPHPLCQRQR